MEFNEALAKNDAARKIAEVLATRDVDLDLLLMFAKLWFDIGKFDARLDAMMGRLSK